jgi:hypothetical protein
VSPPMSITLADFNLAVLLHFSPSLSMERGKLRGSMMGVSRRGLNHVLGRGCTYSSDRSCGHFPVLSGWKNPGGYGLESTVWGSLLGPPGPQFNKGIAACAGCAGTNGKMRESSRKLWTFSYSSMSAIYFEMFPETWIGLEELNQNRLSSAISQFSRKQQCGGEAGIDREEMPNRFYILLPILWDFHCKTQ